MKGYLDMDTEIVTISEFKATCLGLLKKVRRTGESIVVTLRGEPVAMVVPPPEAKHDESWIGSLRSSGKIIGDIVSPVSEESDWEVLGK
jgi:prevent-host-death family protein